MIINHILSQLVQNLANLKEVAYCCTHSTNLQTDGQTYLLPYGTRRMVLRQSSYNTAPWYGNTWGEVNSEAYYFWTLEQMYNNNEFDNIAWLDDSIDGLGCYIE